MRRKWITLYWASIYGRKSYVTILTLFYIHVEMALNGALGHGTLSILHVYGSLLFCCTPAAL